MKRSHESMIAEVQEALAAADVPAPVVQGLMALPNEMLGEIADRLGPFLNLGNARLVNTQMHAIVSGALWAPVRRLKRELESLLRQLDWIRPQPEIQAAFREKRAALQKLLFPPEETALSRMMLLCPELSVMTESRFATIMQRIRVDKGRMAPNEIIRRFGFVARPESRAIRLYANVVWALLRFKYTDDAGEFLNKAFPFAVGHEWSAERPRRFEALYLHPPLAPGLLSKADVHQVQLDAIRKLILEHLGVPSPSGNVTFFGLCDFWLNDAQGKSVHEFIDAHAPHRTTARHFFAPYASLILG